MPPKKVRWPRKTEVVGFRLAAKDAAALRALAEKERMPPSALARQIVLAALEKKPKRRKVK